jgi:hypothetical protein
VQPTSKTQSAAIANLIMMGPQLNTISIVRA